MVGLTHSRCGFSKATRQALRRLAGVAVAVNAQDRELALAVAPLGSVLSKR